MKHFTSVIMVFLAVLSLPGCSQKAATLPENTFYSLVQSDILTSRAQTYAFSENGKQLASANIKLQDGEYYALDESRNYYIAGARSNDNLLSIQGKQSSFHLLDNPHYSGSTAICFEKGITYSSMNGNMDEKEGYLSLVVARDTSTKKTLYKTVVPLFAHDMDVIGNDLYLAGDNQGPHHNSAVITIVNKQTGTIISTQSYRQFSSFSSLVTLGNTLFLLGQSTLSSAKEIYTLQDGKISELPHRQKGDVIDGGGILNIYPCEDKLLVLKANELLLMDKTGAVLSRYKDEKMSEGSHDIQIVDGTIYDIKTAFPEFDYDTTTITQFASQTLKKRGHVTLHVKRLPNQIIIVKPALAEEKTTAAYAQK